MQSKSRTRPSQHEASKTSFTAMRIRGYVVTEYPRYPHIFMVCFKAQGGVLRISSDRDDRRIFLGLKLIDWVAWFKQGFFWIFKTYVFIFHVISFNAFWKFLWLGNSAWDFLSFVGNPRDFLGFDFCPHSIIPATWNPEYPSGFKVAGYSNSRSSLQWTASESF